LTKTMPLSLSCMKLSSIRAQGNIIEYQMLVGSVVIDVGLGREDHGSIPRNCI
jgi:hypothetical protein